MLNKKQLILTNFYFCVGELIQPNTP